jgi:transketolase
MAALPPTACCAPTPGVKRRDGQRAAGAGHGRVQQANSGHPGAPMGMAEMAVALWTRPPAPQPGQPALADRDRFVLSNGHASMLLYALLHLTGYDLPMAS